MDVCERKGEEQKDRRMIEWPLHGLKLKLLKSTVAKTTTPVLCIGRRPPKHGDVKGLHDNGGNWTLLVGESSW